MALNRKLDEIVNVTANLGTQVNQFENQLNSVTNFLTQQFGDEFIQHCSSTREPLSNSISNSTDPEHMHYVVNDGLEPTYQGQEMPPSNSGSTNSTHDNSVVGVGNGSTKSKSRPAAGAIITISSDDSDNAGADLLVNLPAAVVGNTTATTMKKTENPSSSCTINQPATTSRPNSNNGNNTAATKEKFVCNWPGCGQRFKGPYPFGRHKRTHADV